MKKAIKTFYAKNRKAWRSWLERNGSNESAVWLIIYKKTALKKSAGYVEAVEEALCFGWIDSTANKRDEESYLQLFARRKAGSNWSSINKQRVAKLVDEGLMTQKGLDIILVAKKNGMWEASDKVENLEIPHDLGKGFSANTRAADNFEKFPRSVKKAILAWIQSARRVETRQKRINETISLAEKNVRANP